MGDSSRGIVVQVWENVRRERVAARMTIRHCARAMGWSEAKWRHIENGRRKLLADDVPGMAAILGVTCARLYGEQMIMVPGALRRGPRQETTGDDVGELGG